MNKKYETEQEEFWAEKFGSDYIARNVYTKAALNFGKSLPIAPRLTAVIAHGKPKFQGASV